MTKREHKTKLSPAEQGGGGVPKLVGWVETNIGEKLTFYRLPRQHRKHLKCTNMLVRLNEEIKRRTRGKCAASPMPNRACG